ncbi:lipid-A-disaccharide synthase [Thiohalobacter sp. IOR34]|uniref:lipid-A-disaccharide synthase n=1 Tax=Thiohalobacter sp. IOR34 TaxID=3057176 RepID=UPI00339D4CBB
MSGDRPLRIGLVAGEASGDLLGAGLIQALRERCPGIEFEGIGGPLMQAAGCRSLFPMERLSVMGLVEVLRHLPGLLRLRRQLAGHFLARPPDLFVGIDAPDFNLGLERRLRAAGIPVAHYVSPSVWAWRRYRLPRIARSVDRMLTLFPFEAEFYREHAVPVRFVGHPLADMIPAEVDAAAARRALGLEPGAPLLALLPGSRRGEVTRLAPSFIGAAAELARRRPGLQFAAPFATAATRALFEAELGRHPEAPPIRCLDGQSRELMAAADAVLLASGTATLEALLLRRPMVVAYRLAPLSYRLLRRLVRLPYYSLPNLLAGEALVEERLQAAVEPVTLADDLERLLDDTPRRERLAQRFAAIHEQLGGDASGRAAEAVLELLGR